MQWVAFLGLGLFSPALKVQVSDTTMLNNVLQLVTKNFKITLATRHQPSAIPTAFGHFLQTVFLILTQ
jgi:hydrogenase-4 membrane subunit HyfE